MWLAGLVKFLPIRSECVNNAAQEAVERVGPEAKVPWTRQAGRNCARGLQFDTVH